MNSFLPTNPYRLRAYLAIFIATVIWGIGGPVIKYTLKEFSPIIFLNYRFMISAFVSILLFIFFNPHLPKNKKSLLLILLTGFLNTTAALILLFFGFDKTSVINAVIIGATSPVFISIAGVLWLHERITLQSRIGIAVAFAGTIITVLEPILKTNEGPDVFIGNLLILGSVLVGVTASILAKIILRDQVNPLAAANLQFLTALVTLTPIALVIYPYQTIIHQILTAPLQYHAGVWFMAIFSGNLAYFLWYKAEKTIEVGKVSVFSYLTPIISIPLAVLWLNEVITLPFILGTGIIALGVSLAEFKKHTKKKVQTQEPLGESLSKVFS